MTDLTIIKLKDGAFVDSREVAALVGKQHKNLLRDIAGYINHMANSVKLNFEPDRFFLESTYLDSFGREHPRYLISKMGCEMVANKLTGEKGVLFTAAYIVRFNALEAAERDAEIKAYAKPQLSEFNSAAKNVLTGMAYCRIKPRHVIKFLHGVYEPLGIEVQTEGDDFGYYTATQIAWVLGVRSETGRLHSHAVAAIISKLDNLAGHTMVIPYGMVGVMVRYDSHIVEAVDEWLESNGYPRTVSYLDFQYHIRYDFQMPPSGVDLTAA